MKPTPNIALHHALNTKSLTLRYAYHVHLTQRRLYQISVNFVKNIYEFGTPQEQTNITKNQFYPLDFDLCTINACTFIFISFSKYSH